MIGPCAFKTMSKSIRGRRGVRCRRKGSPHRRQKPGTVGIEISRKDRLSERSRKPGWPITQLAIHLHYNGRLAHFHSTLAAFSHLLLFSAARTTPGRGFAIGGTNTDRRRGQKRSQGETYRPETAISRFVTQYLGCRSAIPAGNTAHSRRQTRSSEWLSRACGGVAGMPRDCRGCLPPDIGCRRC